MNKISVDKLKPDIQEVYDYGVNVGTNIAIENIHELVMKFFWQKKTVDDLVEELCMIESEHFRQFSPFEFFAKSLNDSNDSDSLWEKYENGVYDGVNSTINMYKKELYDI